MGQLVSDVTEVLNYNKSKKEAPKISNKKEYKAPSAKKSSNKIENPLSKILSPKTKKEINEANEEIQTINITRKSVTLQLKVINIVLSSGEKEKLVSNLTDEFSVDEIKWLYSKRWRIETNYQYVKYAHLLECFTGESVTAIYQDFYISLLVINIAGTMYMEQKKELDIHSELTVNTYNPSFSNLIYIIKEKYVKYNVFGFLGCIFNIIK